VSWREAGYFDVSAELKPLLHLWSLGIEEQFYLVWPPLLVLIYRRGWPLLARACLLASFALSLWVVTVAPSSAFYLPFTRVWELLLGCELARHRFFAQKAEGSPDVAAWTGAALLGAGCVFIHGGRLFPGAWALLPTVGTFLLLWAGEAAWLNRTFFSLGPMTYVGRISYPLYLWHWPLLSFARIIQAEPPSWETRVVLLAASFLLSALVYHGIEEPVRRGDFSRVVRASAGAMVFVALCAGMIWSENGLPFRNRSLEENLRNVQLVEERDPLCQSRVPIPKLRYCRLADPAAEPTAIIIGDSHANRFYWGLKPVFSARGDNLLQVGGGGCVPFRGVETGMDHEDYHCRTVIDAALDFAVASKRVGTVVLASRGSLYLKGENFDPADKRRYYIRDELSGKTGSAQAYENGLRRTLLELSAAGKRILFIYDNPELDFDPLSCIESRPFRLQSALREPCAVARKSVDERNALQHRIVEKVLREFPRAVSVDPAAALCDDSYCWAKRGGMLLYRDADHLNPSGAELLGRAVRDALNRPEFLTRTGRER
jgi:hypothetical protein